MVITAEVVPVADFEDFLLLFVANTILYIQIPNIQEENSIFAAKIIQTNMKKLIYTFLLILIPFYAVAQEKAWTPETLPIPYLQDSLRYTCNPDGILDVATVETLDSICHALETQKGVQTVLVVVGHIEGDDPYVFNKELFEKYGIGQKGADNGLVITLATLDRSYFISPGKGLEGILPDAICKRIENKLMVPLLKEGDWDAAMILCTRGCAEYILGDDTLLKKAEEEDDGDGVALVLTLLGIGGLIGGVGYSGYRDRHRKCPKCGAKYSLVVTDEKISDVGHWRHVHQIWCCKKCGYSEPQDKRINLAAGAAAGTSILGGGGSRGGGGGFSGGSFGGGSYGGGGAGGRF